MVSRVVASVLIVSAALAVAISAQETKKGVRVTLSNAGQRSIREVHVSPPTKASWGPNLLKNPLLRGQKAEIDLAVDCGVYDIQIVAEKGTEFIEDEVSLCSEKGLSEGDVINVGQAMRIEKAARK